MTAFSMEMQSAFYRLSKSRQNLYLDIKIIINIITD